MGDIYSAINHNVKTLTAQPEMVEGELDAKGNQVYKRIRPSNNMAIEVVLEVDLVAPRR